MKHVCSSKTYICGWHQVCIRWQHWGGEEWWFCGRIPGVTTGFGSVTLALVKPDSPQTTTQIPLCAFISNRTLKLVLEAMTLAKDGSYRVCLCLCVSNRNQSLRKKFWVWFRFGYCSWIGREAELGARVLLYFETRNDTWYVVSQRTKLPCFQQHYGLANPHFLSVWRFVI